jgi:hypothetical protein
VRLRRWFSARALDRLCGAGHISSHFVLIGPEKEARVMLEIFDKCNETPLGRLYLSPDRLRQFAAEALNKADEADALRRAA